MSIDLSYRIKRYSEEIPLFLENGEGGEASEAQVEIFEFRDLVKKDEPLKGSTIVQFLAQNFKNTEFWAYSNPYELPARRYLEITTFVTLAQIEVTKEDLLDAFRQIKNLLMEGKNEEAAELSAKCEAIVMLTDPLQKWLNLSTAFLFYADENPLYYEARTQKLKLSLFEQLTKKERQKLADWTKDYFDKLIQFLVSNNPESFIDAGTEGGQKGFFDALQDITDREKQMNIFVNHIADKNPASRDVLLSYPVHLFYKDMNTFITEGENMKAELERAKQH